jgi:hypothetical protein
VGFRNVAQPVTATIGDQQWPGMIAGRSAGGGGPRSVSPRSPTASARRVCGRCSSGPAPTCPSARRRAGSAPADLTGCTDLGTLAAVMRRCAAVVANDSGPLHVARAVGVPTVGLYWCGNAINAAHRPDPPPTPAELDDPLPGLRHRHQHRGLRPPSGQGCATEPRSSTSSRGGGCSMKSSTCCPTRRHNLSRPGTNTSMKPTPVTAVADPRLVLQPVRPVIRRWLFSGRDT